jgi:hypothetical protein
MNFLQESFSMSLKVMTNHLPRFDCKGRAPLNSAQARFGGKFDVVVVGGGTGGAPAAIVAGQEGLTVAVVEPQSFLGGIGTGGGIHMYYHGLQTGVQESMDRRMEEWNARVGGKASGFHPEAKKLALQEMADEAGVRCFYRTFFAGAVMEGDAIRGVVADDEEGLFWLEAKVVIDCTGDADVAAAAGAPFTFGREGDHAPQPYSLAPGMLKGSDAVSSRNFDAGYVDPTHALEQTRAQFEGRSHLKKERYDESSRMLYIAPILGLRESRFIDAEYVVTLADQQARRRFPDVIARAKAHYDNHAKDYENETEAARLWVTVCGHWSTLMCHDVPYRCLVPRQVENLLVACRAAGMTHDAHQLFRMQRDIQALGEAAAVAAKRAIVSGKTVRQVSVADVQKRLVERNALPPEVLNGQGAESVLPRDLEIEKLTLDELFALFGGKREPDAISEMVRRGSAAHADLRAALKSGNGNHRLLAAIALGLQGLADGAEVLKETLAARREDPATVHRAAPRWLGALNLLDYLGLRKTNSIPLVLSLLEDSALDVNKAASAVGALGRHATAAEALSSIQRVLKRKDIKVELVLQHSVGPVGQPIVSDRRFTLDLTAARVLEKHGAHDEAQALVQKHLNDYRALVRGFAAKALADLRQPESGAVA